MPFSSARLFVCVHVCIVEDTDSAPVGGVPECTGPAHGLRVRVSAQEVSPEKTTYPTRHGRQEETV